MESLWAHSALRDASTGGCRWLVLGLLAAVGCNSGRQLQTDLYQRELRLQEDEIYRLEDCIEEYQAIVRDYRCELAELKGATVVSAASTDRPTPATEPLAETVEARESGGLPETPEPLDLGPPATAEEGEGPDLKEAPAFDSGGDAPAFEGVLLGTDDTLGSVVSAEKTSGGLAFVPASASRSVEGPAPTVPPDPYPHATTASPLPSPSIPLSETIGLRVQNGPDQTLVVRVVDRSTAWLSAFEGDVSVMLTDPKLDGQLRRVARWDFPPSEVREALVSPSDPAVPAELVLPIALPAEVPVGQPLRLWVRLVDAAGNKSLQAVAVRFADRSLRLAEPIGLAAVPRRLPPINIDRAPPPRDEKTVVAAHREASTEDAWRPAQEVPIRRIDPAIQTASFETLTGTSR